MCTVQFCTLKSLCMYVGWYTVHIMYGDWYGLNAFWALLSRGLSVSSGTKAGSTDVDIFYTQPNNKCCTSLEP
jgi:hypothetical protein